MITEKKLEKRAMWFAEGWISHIHWKRFLEKTQLYNLPLYAFLLYYLKVYDQLNRLKLWEVLKYYEVFHNLKNAMKRLHETIIMKIKLYHKTTKSQIV